MKTIFILGDSIAFHYGPYVKKYINSQDFKIITKKGERDAAIDLNNPVGSNGGDSSMVYAFLKGEYEKGALSYDYLLLNCGLHDVKINKGTDFCQVSEREYKENLLNVVQLSNKAGVKIIWVSTTPVDDLIHNKFFDDFKRYNKDVVRYNQIAQEIMSRYEIPIIDMYKFIDGIHGEKYCDHVHFNEWVREKQAIYICKKLDEIVRTY